MLHEVPLVSIIIPTLNRDHAIGETFASVLAQTYTQCNCIVVDDGSTYNTDALVGACVEKAPRPRPLDHLAGLNMAKDFNLSRGRIISLSYKNTNFFKH